MSGPEPASLLRSHGLAITAGVLGVLAAIAPVWPPSVVEARVGWLLSLAAILELRHGLRRANEESRRAAWFWTRQFDGWPFSAEWLSAAFDCNVAPFFQGFFEIRVERPARRIRLIPHGVHGPLRWVDLERSPGLLPAGVSPESTAEGVFAIQ